MTGMRIAVITPYYETPPDWFAQCLDSVVAQTLPCTHIVIADGIADPLVDDYPVQHIVLDTNHGDYGNTPRGIGSVSAMGQGFDAIAYLDADNWITPDHLERLVSASEQAGNTAIASCARNLVRLDGSLLQRCPEVDGEAFVDTSCLFLRRPAFSVIPVWWLTPAKYRWVGDRVLWQHIVKMKLPRVHSSHPTLQYRTSFKSHYRRMGEEPPEGTREMHELPAMLAEMEAKAAR
jgi:glycosyltransferase involved in cell wall biosynthesis